MKNMIDYVEEEKASFSSRSFNGVDSLVLSQLAYLDFDGFVPGIGERSQAVAIEALALGKDREKLYRNTMDSVLNQRLLSAVQDSPRFRKTGINYYVNHLDYDKEEQFSAVTFLLSDGTAYIAFRGTDTNFVGWKEDFNMAFSDTIPSQEESRLYLNAVGALIPGSLRTGGHSKGGNLAVYAAMKCDPSIQERVIDIYSHDGPGFREDVFQSQEYGRVRGRIRQYLPQTALVGMLLEHHENYTVVKSRGIGGLMQHNPFSWAVEHGDFQYREKIDDAAIYADRTIQAWLDSLTDDQRELFIDTLYSVIRETGAKSFSDLTVNGTQKARAALNAIRGIDDETRAFVLQTVQSLIHLALKNLWQIN